MRHSSSSGFCGRTARGRRLLRRQRRETAPARHKGPGKTSDKASATSLAPAVREKSASGRALRAHASCAGASARKTGQRAPVLVFGAESGPRRPVFWVRSAGRIRPEEQGPPRGGSGAARALPGAPRPAASTLRLSLFHRFHPSSSPASRQFTIPVSPVLTGGCPSYHGGANRCAARVAVNGWGAGTA